MGILSGIEVRNLTYQSKGQALFKDLGPRDNAVMAIDSDKWTYNS